MSFRLVPKSVNLNDFERSNGPYSTLFHRIRVQCRRKKFTFAISSPDEFLVFFVTPSFAYSRGQTVEPIPCYCISGEIKLQKFPVLNDLNGDLPVIFAVLERPYT